ncbi:hypothetical protein DFJ43DRAFT_1151769 [Lentinula guzmanii]|uniref:Uncharacterized protein n=1 Tax=Lentinula guzmanii TaxID=2804957 RepID=A0AA38JQ52_9AGAR|nr:hypothetical protein DFJ43DRAFT_1151769 [Lentinula guzmanii]
MPELPVEGDTPLTGSSGPKLRAHRPPKEEKASWTHGDLKHFLDFLADHRSEMGEGYSFKGKTFQAAADHLAPLTTVGGQESKTFPPSFTSFDLTISACVTPSHIRDVDSCKRKLNAIGLIKQQSGWAAWSDEHGAGITTLTSRSWDDFVKKHKEAKPFRNRGWPFLHDFERIMPYQPKGTLVFRPSGARDGTGVQRDASPAWDWDKLEADMGLLRIRRIYGARCSHPQPFYCMLRNTNYVRCCLQGQVASQDNETVHLSVAAESGTGTETPTQLNAPSPPVSTPSSPKPAPPIPPKTPAPLTLKRSSDNIFEQSSSKKAKGSEVLSGLLSEVSGMNKVFRDLLAPPTLPPDPTLLLTPARRAKAISLLEKENDLDTDHAMIFIHALIRDKAIVDTYNSFSNPLMRRAFIDSVLAKEQGF